MDLLPPALDDLVRDERALLDRLGSLLEATGADADLRDRLGDVADGLRDLFLVVVVGEFNAGKSSVLNALFGEKLMEEGPIPTTAKITVLRYGEEPLVRQISEYLVERRHPSPLLRHLRLVDTPGTNSIVRRHQELTERFVPRADLVLFVTSYDRPLSDSERVFLDYLRGAWGKRLVFVLNKADLARSPDDLRQVLAHLAEGCRETMGFEPTVFPVSAELAYAAKTAEAASVREALLEQSRFAPFEAFVRERLAGPDRLALKLAAPLDTAERLLARVGGDLAARRGALHGDEQNLAELESRLEEARAALRSAYERHLGEIDRLLLEMERRGVQYLDDTIRVGRLGLLRDKDRFREEFARQVLRDVDRGIEDRVTAAVDELLEQALALWQRTLREFAERLRRADTRDERALYNRTEVFGAVMREAERKLRTHDLREEARRVLENAGDAADWLGYAGAGAAGLGVLSGVLIGATALDAVGGFGLVTAGVVGAAGLTVLPRQRRKAIAELRERTESLRADLERALRTQFEQEADRALARLSETVEPYAQLVRTERETVAAGEHEHEAIAAELARLRIAAREAAGDAPGRDDDHATRPAE